MKKIISLLFFGLMINNVFAQEDFSKVDTYALKAGKLDGLNMGTIAQLLAKPFSSKKEKARAFYTWIANNIMYDVKLASKQLTDKNSSAEVLQYRKAVGMGFANLFQDMCSNVGIRCLTADGFLKRIVSDIGEKDAEINHRWAIVQLGQSPDTWYYVDAALASGTVDNDLKVFTKKFNDYYFFCDKLVFNYQHFPDNLAWKLDAGPKNKNEFYNNPLIYEGAYVYGLKKIITSQGNLTAKLNAPISFNFNINTTKTISKISLQYGSKKKVKTKDAIFQQNAGNLIITNKFEIADEYPVTIYIDGVLFATYLIVVEE